MLSIVRKLSETGTVAAPPPTELRLPKERAPGQEPEALSLITAANR